MIRAAVLALALTLSGAARVIPENEDVLRTALTLAGAGSRPGYCVAAALTDAPFSGLRRDMAEYAAVEGRPEPDAATRRATLRQVVAGWMGPNGATLDQAAATALTGAALAVAERGDPTPLPMIEVTDLNSAGDPSADPAPARSVPADRVVNRAWLAPGQRFGGLAGCGYPSLSLSAVSREGPFAFVEVGVVGASLAGAGEIWAFHRTAEGWRRIAVRRTWVS